MMVRTLGDKITVDMVSRVVTAGGVFLFILAMTSCVSAQNCTMDSFPVQRHFDLDRFLGVWYTIDWNPAPGSGDVFHNFKYIFTKSSKNRIEYKSRSRALNSDPRDECVDIYHDAWLETTGKSGKFRISNEFTFNEAAGRVEADYWIIKTDYVNYALVFRCDAVDSQGVCTYPFWAVFGRRTTGMSETIVDEVHDAMSQVCQNSSDYQTIEHDNECPYSYSGARALIPMPYVMMILLITGIISKSSF